jgi:RNA polymerase sigma-70 factor, ECF subfamily
MHDDVLIARARAGDERAYAELVRAHEDSARRTAASIAGSNAGEDAAQEAFIKAYRKLGTFRPGAPFGRGSFASSPTKRGTHAGAPRGMRGSRSGPRLHRRPTTRPSGSS